MKRILGNVIRVLATLVAVFGVAMVRWPYVPEDTKEGLVYILVGVSVLIIQIVITELQGE